MRPLNSRLLALLFSCIPLLCHADVVLQVDIGVSDVGAPGGIGNSRNDVQSGFSEFSAAHQFALTGLDQFNAGVVSQARQFGALGVNLSSPLANGALYQDYAGTIALPLGDVAEDGIFARFGADIRLQITGLAPGAYQITTWHHSSVDTRAGGFDIFTSIDNGSSSLVASGIEPSRGFSPVAITEANFGLVLSNPGSMLQVTFSAAPNNGLTVLNGFRITAVPERNALVLLSCVLPFVRCRRRY